jgi:hypothetical protein
MQKETLTLKLLICIVCFVLSISLFGQISDTTKLPEKKSNFFTGKASPVSFDNKNKSGFAFGLGIANFSLQEADLTNSIYKDSITSVTSNRKDASEVNVFMEHNFSPQLAYRIKLSVLFEGIQINYHRPQFVEVLDESYASLALPLSLILQTKGQKSRGYMLLGPSFVYGIGKNDTALKKVIPNQFDMTLDAGIGFYKRFKMFFWGTELKFSQGLFNLNGSTNSIYNQSIDKLMRQSLILSVSISGA